MTSELDDTGRFMRAMNRQRSRPRIERAAANAMACAAAQVTGVEAMAQDLAISDAERQTLAEQDPERWDGQS